MRTPTKTPKSKKNRTPPQPKKPSGNLPDDLRCLNSADMEKLLSCGRVQLWHLRKDPIDPLPHFKAGGKVLYPLQQVQAWIDRGTKKMRLKAQA